MALSAVHSLAQRPEPGQRDFVQRGAASPHAGLFLTQEAVFPHGASEQELAAIYRPRPGLPFKSVTLQTGEQRNLWTTFTAQQVDIDVRHSQGRAYLDAAGEQTESMPQEMNRQMRRQMERARKGRRR